MSISNVITRIKVKKWIKDGLSVGGEKMSKSRGAYQLIHHSHGWLPLEMM